MNAQDVLHGPAIYRNRWECEYLRNLAIQEGSFLSEYRLLPNEFDSLHQILLPFLTKDRQMSANAMGKCGSAQISSGSRLGIARWW